MKTKFNFFKAIALLLVCILPINNLIAQSDWISLFNGKNFSGWEVKMIQSTQLRVMQLLELQKLARQTLFVLKKYGDFIFEVEVLVASGLNSGIQFRSNSKKSYDGGSMDINPNWIQVRGLGPEGYTMKEEEGIISSYYE